MRRVLLITNVFPPLIGGPATFMDRLAHALAARGRRVTVVCSSPAARDPDDARRPFRVVRVSIANRYAYEVRVRAVLVRELLRHRAVFVNSLDGYVAEANRLVRRRCVVKVVGDGVWERARNQGATTLDVDAFQHDAAAQARFAGEIRRRNAWLTAARQVVTPSRYLERLVRGWGVPAESIAVVPNAPDDALLAEPAPEPRPERPLRVLFVGRFTNWKGIETLLLAAARVPEACVRLVGDGPERPAMVQLAAQLGLGARAEFPGALAHEAVRDELRRAHVLVLDSLYEGHPHVVLEAAAVGLPAVVSDRGGNVEAVRPGEGLVVPAGDPSALAAGLAHLAGDEAARHRLAAAAWSAARREPPSAALACIAAMLEAS